MWIIPPCAVADMNLLTPLRNDVVCEKNTVVLLKNPPQIDAIFPPVLLMVTDRFFSACPNQTRPVFSVTVIWISPHIRRLCFDASGDPYGSFNRRCKCDRFRRFFYRLSQSESAVRLRFVSFLNSGGRSCAFGYVKINPIPQRQRWIPYGRSALNPQLWRMNPFRGCIFSDYFLFSVNCTLR